jgi:diamine N-acetyltransferase
MTVRVVPVTRDNWREALSLTVAPEQQRFVADHEPPALVALAKAYVRPGGRLWLPYLIYSDMTAIGMATIVLEEANPSTVWLYHFFLDSRYQGRGLGKAALQALLTTVAVDFNGVESVCLTVHPENTRAQRLYRSAGFESTGREIDGEPVYCLERQTDD